MFNPNSLDNKGSWRILKDFYCSVTMLRDFEGFLLFSNNAEGVRLNASGNRKQVCTLKNNTANLAYGMHGPIL